LYTIYYINFSITKLFLKTFGRYFVIGKTHFSDNYVFVPILHVILVECIAQNVYYV